MPNPARATTYQALLTARDSYDRAAADADAALLAQTTPPPGVTNFTISNADITAATAGRHHAADQLTAAVAAHAAVPARLPLGQTGQQVLGIETKLITDALTLTLNPPGWRVGCSGRDSGNALLVGSMGIATSPHLRSRRASPRCNCATPRPRCLRCSMSRT